jgi:hypothetical protein
MDCSPGSHRPLEVQQPSSGQFPFTGLECDFFQLGGFQVQMAADHAAKSQRQRRGRGIDEADCSSLRHYSPTIDGRGRMRNSGVQRSTFGVRRAQVPGETRGRGVSVGPRRSLRGRPLLRCVRSNRATSASKSTFGHVQFYGEKCCLNLGVDYFRANGTRA